MGRFDPRQMVDDMKHQQHQHDRQQQSSSKEPITVSKKRQRNNQCRVDGDNSMTKNEVVIIKSPRFKELEDNNKKHHGTIEDQKMTILKNDDSSSAPSSSGDSSSVPSSDESDFEDNDFQNKKESNTATSNLKVIAPEQKGGNVGVIENRKRNKITDERIDDLDDGVNPPMVESNPKLRKVIEMALKVSKLPIQDAGKLWNLAPFLIQNLEGNGFKSFFPIQALVIPDVIASERHVHVRNRDICVSAPTGSGKTLAFVLPVLNSLAGRRVKRLRALVVLPSRDLARQVYDVFHRYSKGSDLSIGLSIGQTDFAAEQCALVAGEEYINEPIETRQLRYAMNPFHAKTALHAFYGGAEIDQYDYASLLRSLTQNKLRRSAGLCPNPFGGSSAVDVLVCTPGRLMEHLDSTPGFTLQHLRFLVIDEVDRLLTQSYQNWIPRIIKAVVEGQEKLQTKLNDIGTEDIGALDPVTWRTHFGHLKQNDYEQKAWLNSSVCQSVQLRKMLFSATLTKDPRKLASLGLINPKHYDAHHIKEQQTASSNLQNLQGTYSLPEALEELMVECTAEQKPLVLLSLILEQSQRDDATGQPGIVIVFTSSIDSTHRLARLLQLLFATAGYGPSRSVAEFSRMMTQKQRSKLMLLCNSQSNAPSRIKVIVCSDGMSRGMDIQNVTAVINYDVPSYAKTYVHRCGRTARAGKRGRAITILKGGQVGKFTKLRHLIDGPDKVKVGGIKKELVQDAVPIYKQCVRTLQKILEAEESKELSLVQPLGTEWVEN